MAKFKLKAGQKGALIVLGIEILIEGGKATLGWFKDRNAKSKVAEETANEQKNDEEKSKETVNKKAG